MMQQQTANQVSNTMSQISTMPESTSSRTAAFASVARESALDTIAWAEGLWKNGQRVYNELFANVPFDVNQPHQGRVIRRGRYASTAAGAYQFLEPTWKLANGGANPPMLPAAQDQAAMVLMRRRGVNPDAMLDRNAMHKLAPEWASIPTLSGRSYHGQPVKSHAEIEQFYRDRVRARYLMAESMPESAPVLPAAGARPYRVGDTIPPQAGAPPAPVLPVAVPPVPSIARPRIDTAATIAGLNLPTPVVSGVNDVMATRENLETLIRDAEEKALALGEKALLQTWDQAKLLIDQSFTSEVNRITKPMDDLLKAHEDRLAYEREYADLITDKVSPELADQVIKIRQQTQAQVDQLSTVHKMIDAMEELFKSKNQLTDDAKEFLESWRKGLVSQEDALIQRGQTAITNAEASASPEGRLKDEVLTLRTELNKLEDPVNQIVAGAKAIGDAFHDSFRQAITGSISAREAFANFFQSVGQHFVDMGSRMIATYMQMELIGLVAKFLPPSVPSLGFGSAAPDLSSVLGNAGPGLGFDPSAMTGGTPWSFAGGGYTGNGARAGGVDGQGGFPAILHPQETVVDHWSANRDLFNGMGTLAGESPYDENQQALDSQGRAFSDNQDALDSRERAFSENQKLITQNTMLNRERTLERERVAALAGGYEPIEVNVNAVDPASTGLVTVDQLAQSSQMAVKQAQTQLLAKLKNNPAVRAGAGL